MLTNHNDIKSWLDNMNIENYTIHDTGTVTVDGDVILGGKQLITIPVQFRIVYGNFDCWNSNLKSLEGCPRDVGGFFDCSYNGVKSLEGAPREVGGDFYCSYNNLESLNGSPPDIDGDFDCGYNDLESLNGAPLEVWGDFYCWSNNFKTEPKCDTIINGRLFWK